MSMKITDDCVCCGSCIDECDINHAISEGDPIYVIDPAKCTNVPRPVASRSAPRSARPKPSSRPDIRPRSNREPRPARA